MRDFLDTKFDGFGESFISLTLVRKNGPTLYLIHVPPAAPDLFVCDYEQARLESMPASVVTAT